MLVPLLIVTALSVGFYELHKLYRREFPELARKLGFELRSGRFELPLGRAIVRIDSAGQGQLKLSLDMRAIVGTKLRLKKRLFLASTRAMTGDPTLDQHFHIDDAVAATAYMAPISQVLLQIFSEVGAGQSISCEGGVIQVSAMLAGTDTFAEAWLTRFKMIALSVDREALTTEQRLRRNMVNGDPGLRLRSLQLLERAFAKTASHVAAVRDGLHDEDLLVRIEAARQGRSTEHLESIVRDESNDASLRMRALDAYERIASSFELVTLLMPLVTDKHSAVSIHAIGKLKMLGEPDLAKRFVRLLDVAQGERFLALVDALERVGDSAIEEPLLEILGRCDGDDRRAVCKLLGELGTVRSVPVLRELEKQGVNSAAAIAQIQSRIAGAEAGQLSVLPTLDGALSVAKKE
jgi:HEAT repeat protein